MKIEKTPLEGCFIIHDTYFSDRRGYFFESYNKNTFLKNTGVAIDFVQDNQSQSSKGVLRGLHFQHGEFAQAKLIRVISGTVLDVAVDLRKNSKTFGQHVAVELSGETRTQFFIPRGFAHGFVVLSKLATFFYKSDNFYKKEAEEGIVYNDPDLDIDWKLQSNQFILSDKDTQLPFFKDSIKSLQF